MLDNSYDTQAHGKWCEPAAHSVEACFKNSTVVPSVATIEWSLIRLISA